MSKFKNRLHLELFKFKMIARSIDIYHARSRNLPVFDTICHQQPIRRFCILKQIVFLCLLGKKICGSYHCCLCNNGSAGPHWPIMRSGFLDRFDCHVISPDTVHVGLTVEIHREPAAVTMIISINSQLINCLISHTDKSVLLAYSSTVDLLW